MRFFYFSSDESILHRRAKFGEKNDNVDKKLPDVSGLVTTSTVLDRKIGEVENKIALGSGLLKRTDYGAKISDIEKKDLTTSDYNKYLMQR